MDPLTNNSNQAQTPTVQTIPPAVSGLLPGVNLENIEMEDSIRELIKNTPEGSLHQALEDADPDIRGKLLSAMDDAMNQIDSPVPGADEYFREDQVPPEPDTATQPTTSQTPSTEIPSSPEDGGDPGQQTEGITGQEVIPGQPAPTGTVPDPMTQMLQLYKEQQVQMQQSAALAEDRDRQFQALLEQQSQFQQVQAAPPAPALPDFHENPQGHIEGVLAQMLSPLHDSLKELQAAQVSQQQATQRTQEEQRLMVSQYQSEQKFKGWKNVVQPALTRIREDENFAGQFGGFSDPASEMYFWSLGKAAHEQMTAGGRPSNPIPTPQETAQLAGAPVAPQVPPPGTMDNVLSGLANPPTGRVTPGLDSAGGSATTGGMDLGGMDPYQRSEYLKQLSQTDPMRFEQMLTQME